MRSMIHTRADCERFVTRSKAALSRLAQNLSALGYAFANSGGPLQFAQPADIQALERLAASHGPLPKLYEHWYRTFRCVDFSQHPSQLEQAGHLLSGIGLNCPLVFLDLLECTALRDHLGQLGLQVSTPDGRWLMPTGTAASNCDPKGVWIPADSLDPELYDEGAGSVTMSVEITNAIEHGGFPFWQQCLRRGLTASPLGFTPDYQRVRPLLLSGVTLVGDT